MCQVSRGTLSIYLYMVQCSESDYRLLPSFIASTRSVLNPMNRDVKSCGHATVFASHPTDWNTDCGQSANNSRFNQHELHWLKYPDFTNEISELK